jgi:DNA polymerase-3 subunit alpha
MFGRGNFFLEIQDHHLGPDKAVTEAMFRLEKDLDIPLIATNDSHYIEDQDSRAHEVLLCVQTAGSDERPQALQVRHATSSTSSPPKRCSALRARTRSLHPHHAVSRALQVRAQPRSKIRSRSSTCPAGMDLDTYFEQVCRAGWRKRRDTAIRTSKDTGKLRKSIADYEARLNREIDCIKQMKFPGYFMIVWDFIRYAREQKFPSAQAAVRPPVRSSPTSWRSRTSIRCRTTCSLSASSIPNASPCPISTSTSDMNRRGEVIEYVRNKYGNDQVAQIITFNTMAAKAAIKDVGRALDMPYGEVDRIAKLIPPTIGITIERALKDSPPLAQAYAAEPRIKELIDTAKRLEGLVRGAGVHAAGVVIAPQPLTELVPVTRTKDEAIVTSYDMKSIEAMGLLKMDFLGLTTLTVIDDCLKLIQSNRGESVDMATIPLDDTETFEKVFHRALTSGVFQFESGGMRDVLRRYKPSSIEHLTALNALYRPGPMNMIDDFIERKWGRKEVIYELPEMRSILEETLGVMVYQEQVMQISATSSRDTPSVKRTFCAAPWARRTQQQWPNSASASWPEQRS